MKSGEGVLPDADQGVPLKCCRICGSDVLFVRSSLESRRIVRALYAPSAVASMFSFVCESLPIHKPGCHPPLSLGSLSALSLNKTSSPK